MLILRPCLMANSSFNQAARWRLKMSRALFQSSAAQNRQDASLLRTARRLNSRLSLSVVRWSVRHPGIVPSLA